MSENEFLNALKEEMPESFGRELLAQLNAEEKKKPKSFPAFWTVAAASIVTVLVGVVLFMSRMPNEVPLSLAQAIWQLRDPITPENIQRIEPLLTIGYGHAKAIALSPDNNTLAVATNMGIYLHDAHNLAAEATFLGLPEDVDFGVGYSTRINYMEYLSDGRLFVLIQTFSELRLYQWDEMNQSFIRRHTLGNPSLIVQVVDISPDGSKLLVGGCSISGGSDGAYCSNVSIARIHLVNLLDGSDILLRIPRQTSNAIAAMNPDWTLLAYEEENKIRLYDLASQETVDLLLIGNTNGNQGQVMDSDEMHRLYFSPDGSQIGIIDASGKPMDWWNLSELQAEARTVRQYGTDMYGSSYPPFRPVAALNPITAEYVMASGSSLLLLDYDANDVLAGLRTNSESYPLTYAVGSDGRKMYGLDPSGLIRVWTWEGLALEALNVRYTLGNNSVFSFSADSNRFVTAYNWQGLGFAYDISGMDVESQFLETRLNVYLSTNSNAMSQDGRYVAFYQEYAIWLYDLESQSSHQIAIIPSNYVPTREPLLQFREDGSLLMLQQSESNHSGRITEFSPEDLASGEVIYPLDSFDMAYDLTSNTRYQYRSEFSSDGTMMLSWRCELEETENVPANCNNPILKLYDTFTWEELANLEIGIEKDTMMANFFFSSDSEKIFLSYCEDIAEVGWTCDDESHVLEIWNIADLETHLAPYMRTNTLAEENAVIIDVLSYPDGSFLFASWDWETADVNLQDFVPIMVFWELDPDGTVTERVRMPMRDISFAPDGSYFLTSKDGLIELWGVPATVASGS